MTTASAEQGSDYWKNAMEGHSFKVEKRLMGHLYDLFYGVKDRLGFTEDIDFYITGDTTVYAIWSDTDYEGTRPATSTLNSIRTDEYNGIRFMASVHNSQRAIAEEYGFIVTRSKLLGNKALDFNLAEGTYVSGAAYEKNGDADYIYEATEDFTIFTAVFVGMPEKAEFYEKEIVARPYIKYSNGTVVYGKTHKRCVLSVAESIRDNGYTDVNGNPMDEVSKAKIQKVLTTCGKSL